MKLLSYLLFLFTAASQGQSVQFQIQRINPCSTVPVIEKEFYSLTDTVGGVWQDYSNFNSTIVTLPKPGKYILYRYSEAESQPYLVDLKEGLTIETIHDPKIMLRLPSTLDANFVYETCGKLSEGYQEEFYPDGRIKIRGNFKEGFIKDSVAEYFSNGKRKYQCQYKKKEVLTTRYDSINGKTSIYWSQRGSFMIYHSHSSTVFFPNQTVNWIRSDIKNITTIREYYPDGTLKLKQTKNRRIEYYANGKPKINYEWRRKTAGSYLDGKRYNFRITTRTYTEAGILLSTETKVDKSNSHYKQPEIAYSDKHLK
jgi:antitoxin component YwqK of YwqJK toxin-antitoxin module